MTFLQPLLLAGLPLVALPIVIHLINRQRHRTVPWGAMMFLLDAKRLTRGMARLRFWLIMAMRMLAIAGLILALGRPLASGWLGLAIGGQPDTTIMVLDRSASMQQQDFQDGQSKRSTALRKLAELINTFGTRTRIVLVENTRATPEPIESADSLLELPDTAATATAADVPAMLQAALDYVVANQTGRTDIWICSDLRESDWKSDDGRWSAIREGFERLDGIRFYLLSYPETAGDNWAVSVTDAKRRQVGKTAELVLDIAFQRASVPQAPVKIPLELTINGARSVLNLETAENEYILQGHRIPLDANTTSGWGRVTVPVDANPVDNEFYFVFSEPPEHHTVIVSDDARTADLLRLAAVSPVDPALLYDAAVLTSDRTGEIDWGATSLVLWHAPLPDAITARPIQDFVESGRPIIFFPPEQGGSNELFGAKWGDWQRTEGGQPAPVASWRGESDLLGHTRSGAPLPVGKLRVQRYCPLQGRGSPLARLEGGQPLLVRGADTDGPIYFMTTLPRADCSSLAQDGVVFYVMIQRALSVGAARLGKARQLTAGTDAAQEVARWGMLSELPDEAFQSDRPLYAGAYQEGDKLIALNRPPSEDRTRTLDDVAVERIFSGLDYRQVKDRIGNSASLASEIWRALLVAMAVALLIEAWLCMPEQKRQDSNQPSAVSGQFSQQAA